MSARPLCSCGRAEVELGCDLCAHCRDDYEQNVYEAFVANETLDGFMDDVAEIPRAGETGND